MDEVVVQNAHPSHVLTYRDSLGFLDRLRHIITLLLSGVDGEDGHLVELDTVQKGHIPNGDLFSLITATFLGPVEGGWVEGGGWEEVCDEDCKIPSF